MAKAGLVAALGLVAAAQAAPLAALPLLMDALVLGADRLGVAVAAGLLTTLALAPRAGALADRHRPSRMARRGLGAILAASALLCAYTALVLDGTLPAGDAFAVVLATRIANGVGVAVLHPAAQTWLWAGVGDEEGERLQGRASAAQNAGRFAGPVCVALAGGWGAAWTLAALAAVAASALLVLVLTPDPVPEAGGVPPPRAEAPRRDPPSRDTRRLLAALLALHLLGGGAQFLLGPLLMARLDLDPSEAASRAGWLMALAGAAAVAGNLLARRVPGRHRRAAAGAALATAGAVALAPFAGTVSVAAGVAAVAAGIGAAVPSTMAELMRRSPAAARGRAAGRASAVQAASYAVAAPACGLLFAADPVLAAASLPVPAAAAWLVLATVGRNRSGEAAARAPTNAADAGGHGPLAPRAGRAQARR